MTPSATSELFAEVARLREAGVDVISFNVGEPDFPTPVKIRDACKRALDEGKTKYASVSGITPLKEVICDKFLQDNQIIYEKDQICISTGGKQAIYNAVMAVCDPEDEVLLPTPCWVSYVEMIKLAQGIPVLVPPLNNYQLDLETIKNRITKKTKAIIINTPNNPTGICYTEESLRELGNLAVEYGFYIISDEVYEKLVYDGNRHVCIAGLSEDIYKQSIIVNGFSKSHSMTGWRIGYTAASKEIIRGITSLQGHITSNRTTFVQWAALEGLKSCNQSVMEMKEEFQKRRDYMYQTINAFPGIECMKPEGAFYLMPDVHAYFGKKAGDRVIQNADDFCLYMLEEANIAMVPGTAFWIPNTVRLAYTDSLDRLQEGMERFRKALKKLN